MMQLMKRAGNGREPYFYGWVIVAVMAATGAVSMGMGSLNFGLFIKPMGDELGIGRAAFGWAQTARQGASSATSPLIGWLLDRYGSRVMLPVAALATGCALIGLAYVTSAWHLVVLFVVMGLVGMSGPGALVTTVPVLKWFVRNRGKAVAFVGLGIPIGALLFIPLTQVLINEIGWRGAWIVLAIIGIVVIVPLAAIFVRRQPEDVGLVPDGDLPEDSADGEGSRRLVEEVSWTVREAVRTTTLWRLVIVFSMVQLATGTVALHRIAAFMDRGMDPTLISFATAFDAVAAGGSTFLFGMLVRWIPARFLGGFGFSMLAGASVLTIYATNLPIMFVSMWIFGMGIGGMMFLNNFIWADYFGRGSVGGIRGLANPINLVVGGIGAPAAGYVRDWTGSYDPAWWVGVGLMSGAALLIVLTRAPRKE
ncbi:MAG: MFS transporter [Chloroflexi bacterium]|nr:MFS transporter [Chloroflexota bacterium]MYK62365.1 MFS transporter [Chloroflexota bacterium]